MLFIILVYGGGGKVSSQADRIPSVSATFRDIYTRFQRSPEKRRRSVLQNPFSGAAHPRRRRKNGGTEPLASRSLSEQAERFKQAESSSTLNSSSKPKIRASRTVQAGRKFGQAESSDEPNSSSALNSSIELNNRTAGTDLSRRNIRRGIRPKRESAGPGAVFLFLSISIAQNSSFVNKNKKRQKTALKEGFSQIVTFL